MESVEIYIETENAAFQPDPRREVARILRKIASDIESGEKASVMDINGNRVGRIKVKEEVHGYAN